VNQIIFYITVLLIFSSCSFSKSTDDILLARVGDSYLYQSDIQSVKSLKLNRPDSIMYVHQYIKNWAEQKLLLQKALLNINQDELEIDSRISDYKNSLLIHAYEQKLIQQSIDTLLTFVDIDNYYKAHSDDYYLSENIIKIMFVKASLIAPNLDSLEYWIFHEDMLQIEKIQEYCHQYSKRFYHNPNKWVTWSDFINIFPSQFDLTALSLTNKTLLLKDTTDVYLFRLIDAKEHNEIAPLDYVQEKIKSILLNQKKTNTIDHIKLKLFEDAKNANEFEIY
jgi:hypothetical protein